MPNTPFIGLSVLVHVCVIFWSTLFRRSTERVWKKKNTGIVGRLFGFGIIVVIFLSVILNAGILLHSSITDSRSSVRFVGSLVKRAWSSTQLASSSSGSVVLLAASGGTASSTIEEVSSMIVPSDCPVIFYELASRYNGSIDDYLYIHYGHYSPVFKNKIASEIGIESYRGTSEQNQVMLMRLFAKNAEIEAYDPSGTCKKTGSMVISTTILQHLIENAIELATHTITIN